MRILITGVVVFVIWGVFSAWVYNDKLLPVLNAPEPVAAVPANTSTADSLARILEAMPKTLSVYFEFNDCKFKSDQETDSRIAEMKGWLEKYPGATLTVSGHTDLVGTEEFNKELGMKRAQVIGKYIESQGIEASRMLVESKGENQPVGDYLSEEGRAKNRRTEVTIKMQ